MAQSVSKITHRLEIKIIVLCWAMKLTSVSSESEVIEVIAPNFPISLNLLSASLGSQEIKIGGMLLLLGGIFAICDLIESRVGNVERCLLPEIRD